MPNKDPIHTIFFYPIVALCVHYCMKVKQTRKFKFDESIYIYNGSVHDP